MDKRGQFFLIAAIVIIGSVIGLATTVNSIKTGNDNKAFYNLGKEIGFETKRVLDYGVVRKEDVLDLSRTFLEQYKNYIAQEQVVFIFGDENEMQALFFENSQSGSVGISTGTQISGTITIEDLVGRLADVDYTQGSETVSVLIKDINYDFRLKQGQNFFFVIIKEQDGERFVVKG